MLKTHIGGLNVLPKYSVIIPVYNAEKTMHRCLDSLLDEQYEAAEIIIVDDGSEDSSNQICLEYATACSNVHYLKKDNGGVSSARNAGLDIARGEYIVFVDSDDYVMPHFFASLDLILTAGPSDYIHFSYYVDNGKEKREERRSKYAHRSREEMIPSLIEAICNKTIHSPWAKIYRREIIEKNAIRFLEGVSVGEDFAFNIAYSLHINSFSTSDLLLYVVNIENMSSLSRKKHSDLEKQLSAAEDYINLAIQSSSVPEKEKVQYKLALNYNHSREVYYEAKQMHLGNVGWVERQKRIWRKCREINKKNTRFPRTRYCIITTLPIRFYLTPVIDTIAWKLTH